MNALDAEKKCGIETFFTTSKGIGGKLRTVPEDFIVDELPRFPTKKDEGAFVIAQVTSKGWETHRLVKELARRLHISQKRVGFAGTKDKRAISTQLMSFYNIPNEAISKITLKDVEIKNLHRSDHPIHIGNLQGNQFKITIRNVNKTITKQHIQKPISSILKLNGFPNFYGIQRFGVIRPISHIVGRHIVHGDFEQAVMSYTANPIIGEDEPIYAFRSELQQTYDFSKALRSFPDTLNYEKAMLNRLVVDPKDFIGALMELPRNLLTIFVYAFQSYLFNRMLSERIRKGIPLNQAVPGDIVLPVRNQMIDEHGIHATTTNIEKINKQIDNRKAYVSGLLVGSDAIFSNGEMGEIEHQIVNKEDIDPRDFIIPEVPFLSSSGGRRALLASVTTIDYGIAKDAHNKGKNAVTLQFHLQKGCYATSLLRELMKSNDICNY
jgi:tRNA pseudouridine13 synthase